VATRIATAVWQGGLKEGKGTFSTGSGAIKDLGYSFMTRFESAPGSNPEELIAAAHASCFSMALSAQLGNAGITPKSVKTTCSLKFEKVEAGWTVLESNLETTVEAPGADKAKFDTAAQNAEKGCPISRLLNAKISLKATLKA
jgi:osmotically inducible protein OsmC